MFDNLSSRLDRAFKTLKGHSTLTELNIAETVKEIRRALIDADVHKTTEKFTDLPIIHTGYRGECAYECISWSVND